MWVGILVQLAALEFYEPDNPEFVAVQLFNPAGEVCQNISVHRDAYAETCQPVVCFPYSGSIATVEQKQPEQLCRWR